MGEWQPIETAPDGEIVLVYDPKGNPGIANATGIYMAANRCVREGWCSTVDGVKKIKDYDWCYVENMGFRLCPTHWMPLPPPPQENEE